jgi:hypothetical protein
MKIKIVLFFPLWSDMFYTISLLKLPHIQDVQGTSKSVHILFVATSGHIEMLVCIYYFLIFVNGYC